MKRKRPGDSDVTQVVPVVELPTPRRPRDPVEERPGFARGYPRKRPRTDTQVENMRKQRNISSKLPPDPGGGRLPPLRRVNEHYRELEVRGRGVFSGSQQVHRAFTHGGALAWAKQRAESVRANPQVGEHPDLFEGTTWRDAATGEITARRHAMTPVFVPLEDLTREQLLELSPDQFTNKEWAELDRDLQDEIELAHKERLSGNWREYIGKSLEEVPDDLFNALDGDEQNEILEHSPPVVEFVEFLTSRYKAMQDDESEYMNERAMEYLDDIIASESGSWVETLRRSRYSGNYDVDELIESWEQDNVQFEDIDDAINQAMSDNNNWDIESNGYGSFTTIHVSDSFYVDSSEIPSRNEMDDLELEFALKKVEEETDLSFSTHRYGRDKAYDLDYLRKYGIDISEAVEHEYGASPDWDKITQAVEGLLEEKYEGVRLEPTESKDDPKNIVHRYKDKSYVYDCPAKELPNEGARMGHCVGRPSMGYGRAVASGESKIFSIRTESGRPKFTIEASVKDGSVTSIDQVKGKSNRLPGWDLGKEGIGKIKLDEVEKVFEFLETLGPRVDIMNIRDLAPAIDHIELKAAEGDAAMQRLADKYSIPFSDLEAKYTPEQREAIALATYPDGWPRENLRRRNPCSTCKAPRHAGKTFCDPVG